MHRVKTSPSEKRAKADIAGAPTEVCSTLRMSSSLATRRAIKILASNAHKIRFAVYCCSWGKAPYTVPVDCVTSFSPELIVWALDTDIHIKLSVIFLNQQFLKLWLTTSYSLDWQARFSGCNGCNGPSNRTESSWLFAQSHNFWDATVYW